MHRLLLLLGALASTLSAQQPVAVMPLPAELTLGPGRIRLDSTFTIAADGHTDGRLQRAMERFRVRLAQRLAVPLADPADPASATLIVRVAGPGERVQSPAEDESYRLEVGAGRVRLSAPTVVGALRGFETVLQLVSADSAGFYLPEAAINDRPRFRWRGLLVDASRHFMPPEMIRRTLDGMSVVKLNVLHWHLSEDQGFRVESRRYPRLQQFGSDGHYYTQQQIRELVEYARDRGIRVVPEFDMPGHATSWFTGYPEFASAPGPYRIERRFGVFDPVFDPTREATYQFIDGFIAEMVTLFPDTYWHIGGDEVNGRQWNRNPRITRYKREHGLADNDALQARFNQRLSGILTAHGRRMVGWDEILHPGLPPGTVVQSWRGTEYLSQAARQGFAGILSAPWYLDHIDPTDQLYLADPLPAGNPLTAEEADRVLGGEACMWAEHVSNETVDSRIWPRLAAIAERLWSPGSVRDVDDMYRRLSLVSIHLERAGPGHEAHTYRMLRLLAGERGIQPLHDLLAATMPADFSQRSRLQRPTQLTPLTRLVDAARPDPWVRSRLNRLARQLVADPASLTARRELAASFQGWLSLPGKVEALAGTVPLAAEGIPAARGLGALGALGLQALDHLGGGSPPEWRPLARASLDSLALPQGLLRLAPVEAVRILLERLPD